MQNKIIIGILGLALVASAILNVVLVAKVTQLEKQLKPVKAQQAAQSRQQALRKKFVQRYDQDRQKYTKEQMDEAENLMRIGDQKWGSPEAVEACHTNFCLRLHYSVDAGKKGHAEAIPLEAA
jgi:hypothetical protein